MILVFSQDEKNDASIEEKGSIRVRLLHRSVTEAEIETETEIATVVAEHQRWNRKTAKNKEKSEQAIVACSYHLVNQMKNP